MRVFVQCDLVDSSSLKDSSGNAAKTPRFVEELIPVRRSEDVTTDYPSTPAGQGVFCLNVSRDTFAQLSADANYEVLGT